MDKKSAAIHPSMAHQPALLTDKWEGTPHTPPALHQLQQQPLPSLGLHWQKELKALKNSCAAPWENFSPSSSCNQHQKAAARANRQHWTGPFSQESPDVTPKPSPWLQLEPLSDQQCPLFHCTKDGSTRPLHPGFLHSYHFLKWKVQQFPHQVDLPLPQCLADTCVATPAVALCLSSFNHGERLWEHHKELSPPHNTWMSCASCESWLKSQWGKWLLHSPRQTASLVAVQLLAIPRW